MVYLSENVCTGNSQLFTDSYVFCDVTIDMSLPKKKNLTASVNAKICFEFFQSFCQELDGSWFTRREFDCGAVIQGVSDSRVRGSDESAKLKLDRGREGD